MIYLYILNATWPKRNARFCEEIFFNTVNEWLGSSVLPLYRFLYRMVKCTIKKLNSLILNFTTVSLKRKKIKINKNIHNIQSINIYNLKYHALIYFAITFPGASNIIINIVIP